MSFKEHQEENFLAERELRALHSLNFIHDLTQDAAEETVRAVKKQKTNKKALVRLDGEPVPLWLYKLEGLHESFECEICGNFTYRGRKNFDKHFQEWRHANGMKLLRIPNTRHFHDIIKIENARKLYSKLEGQIKNEFEAVEEFETPDGQKIVQKQVYSLS
eukprot:snap_masked-scaffold_45-processed-gene-0.42-mRNA-1 protein AED:0.09 eAED:0.09 QI:0/-1/0/1/-1/1/1/0/160